MGGGAYAFRDSNSIFLSKGECRKPHRIPFPIRFPIEYSKFSHFLDMAFSSFRGGMRGERRWGCGWLAAAKMGDILPATTPSSPCYLTPWYVRSPAFSTSVSNKEAQSTSPLLLPKYPPVDCAAMTEKIRIQNLDAHIFM